jgi:NADH-quinone oxidoreductase subunit L
MFHYLWLIPLLPLAGFVLNGLFGARMGKSFVTVVGCGTVLVAFVLSGAAVYELGTTDLATYSVAKGSGLRVSAEHRRVELMVWDWFPSVDDGSPAGEMAEASGVDGRPAQGAMGGGNPGAEPPPAHGSSQEGVAAGESRPYAPSLHVPFLLTLDSLSAVMLLVVTGVGFLIHVYSIGYMAEDKAYWRFFSYLNLFMASMLTLVLGGAFPVMFVGWEGVGLCSYLLIGFWYDTEANAQAGRKAFITNRIGDAGFVLGVLILWGAFGTMEMAPIMESLAGGHHGVGTGLLTAAALLLFVGACGKSAQIPLYVWLPDAMAGPTPVSALIHAATMVTAGVYMVVRSGALFVSAPIAMTTVAVVGGATALFAATIGIAQNDIKKVLAYSTVSQLGYMFLGAGVGAFTGAIFHLMTHAFFKALLFLGAGAVIHAMHHEQDMMKMGALNGRLPWTYGAMLAGWLAIAGVFPLAGFWSKDEILLGAFVTNKGLWIAGLAGALLTALYMTRLIGLTFWGESRVDPHVESHIHEVPGTMKWVLVTLAVLALIGGGLNLPGIGGHLLADWLQPTLALSDSAAIHAAAAGRGAMEIAAMDHGGAEAGAVEAASGGAAADHGGGGHHVSLATELGLMGLSLAVAIAGILIGLYYYRKGRGEKAGQLARSFGGLYRLLRDKYRIDELYDATVLRAYYALCRLFNVTDAYGVDGTVNGVASVVEVSGNVFKLFHTGVVRNYALFFLLGAAAIVWYLVG